MSSEPAGAPAETPAEPGGGHRVPAPDDQATQVLPATGEQPAAEAAASGAETRGEGERTVIAPDQTVAIQQPEPRRDLPAGIDPGELADAPVPSARRGKLRRRLRYLRAVRDLLLRDLGGFAYEIQRTAAGTAQEAHRRLIEAKTNRIAALDAEVRGLEARLAEPHGDALLREPGIGGTCPECGELHASDAHYCSRCGAPLDAKARARRDAAVAAAAVQQTTASHPTAEPAPASVLWAAGPRPERTTPEPEAEEEEPHPSEATSQWLALPQHRAETPAPEADEKATGDKPPVTGWANVAAGDEKPSEPAEAPPAVPAAEAAEAPAEIAPAKPKRPRASRAKKPAAETTDLPPAETAAETTDLPAAETAAAKAHKPAPKTADVPAANEPAAAKADEPAAETANEPAAENPAAEPADVPPKPKRTRAKKPAAAAAEFDPAPNGKRDEDVPPPVASPDPLTSRRDQGS